MSQEFVTPLQAQLLAIARRAAAQIRSAAFGQDTFNAGVVFDAAEAAEEAIFNLLDACASYGRSELAEDAIKSHYGRTKDEPLLSARTFGALAEKAASEAGGGMRATVVCLNGRRDSGGGDAA